MTDNEIIKALEICGDQTKEDGHCISCPCKDACYGEEGIHALEKAALDLIKRQQAEITLKTEYIQEQRDVIAELKDKIERFADRIVERLEEKTAYVGCSFAPKEKMTKIIKTDKAIAIVKGVQNE